MPQHSRRSGARRVLATAAATALAAGLAVTGSVAAAGSAAAAGVAVRAGGTPQTSVFPSDRFTVADAAQRTGRRVALPTPAGCASAAPPSACDATRLANRLDGFDIRPRVSVPFTGRIDVGTARADGVHVERPDGTRTPLVQLVFDDDTNTLYGLPEDYLEEGRRHHVVVTSAVKGADGTAVSPCAAPGLCAPGSTTLRVPFTTMTTTHQADQVRRALDDGSAYAQAAITDRRLSFDGVAPDGKPLGSRTVFAAPAVTDITRNDQRTTDPTRLTSERVLISSRAGYRTYAFGSFESPQFTTSDGVLPDPGGSTVTPRPLRKERLGVTLVLPATCPAGGCPVAIYGNGITRSKYDLFLAADLNASRGFATVSTDPVGHAYGPASTATVFQGPQRTTFQVFGRGRDLDGDGLISDQEGVGPRARKEKRGDTFVDVAPHPDAATGLSGGLLQTAIDHLVLTRAIAAGVDVDGDGTNDLRTDDTRYYSLSLGGYYGPVFVGSDPTVDTAFFNVPGASIPETARLSGFRDDAAAVLRVNRPNLLNGGPGLAGFTEDMPFRGDPPVVDPRPGAVQIQQALAVVDWVSRRGSPEAYVSRLLLRPHEGAPAKKVAFQFAFGDATVPNTQSGELVRAGRIPRERISYYRNDRTPTFRANPHGFLIDPRITGRQAGQEQMAEFVGSDGATFRQPASGAAYFETPIADLRNLDCLHYPDPQTGVAYTGQANGPDCVDRSGEAPVQRGPRVSLRTSSAVITAGNRPLLVGAVTDAASRPVARTEVRVLQRQGREAGFRQVATVLTDAGGRFEVRVAPSEVAQVVARAAGLDSERVGLRVARRLEVTTPGPGTVGRSTAFAGTLLPRGPARVGVAYIDGRGTYRYLGQADADREGRWRVARALPSGTHTFVVYTPSTGTNLRGARSLRLTVR